MRDKKINGSSLKRKRSKEVISAKDELETDEIKVDKVISMQQSKQSLHDNPKKTGGRIKRHREELLDLQTKDPEFFEFLKQNDSSLLGFGENESDDDEEEDIENEIEEYNYDLKGDTLEDFDGEGENEEECEIISKKKIRKEKSLIEVDQAVLDPLIEQSINGSLPSLKKILSVFRAACLPSSEDIDEDDDEEDSSSRPSSRYLVSTPEAYEIVMTKVLDNAYKAFYKILGLSSQPSKQQVSSIEKHPKWKKQISLMVLSFYKSVLHTLSALADNLSQGQVTLFLINALEPYIVLLAPMPRLMKACLKVLLKLWSTDVTVAESADVGTVRAHVFLRIRHIAMALPGTATEECFRLAYLTYEHAAKSFTELSGPSVLFMAQCIVELYQTDTSLAYQHAFLYIRQLALTLRGAIAKKDKDAERLVSSWQYLNCFRLWTRLLCVMPEDGGLRPLLFPLTQIGLGVLTALPSFYYVPLKCHIITCLQQLASYTSSFIPTAAAVFSILEDAELTQKPVPSTEVPPKLQYIVKLTTDSASRQNVRDLIVQEAVTLLRQDAEIYRYHVALPEYCFLTIKKLKAFQKKSKIGRWRDLVRALSSHLEQVVFLVKRDRAKLGKSPMEVTAFEPLLGPGEPVAAARLKRLMAARGLNSVSEVAVGALAGIEQQGQQKEEEEKKIVAAATMKKGKKTSKRKQQQQEAGRKFGATNNEEASDNMGEAVEDEVMPFSWSDEED